MQIVIIHMQMTRHARHTMPLDINGRIGNFCVIKPRVTSDAISRYSIVVFLLNYAGSALVTDGLNGVLRRSR